MIPESQTCVILAGGLGTRLREETELVPKPMVMVGDKPLIWHVMQNYSKYNVNNFIICTGYKGDKIAEFFSNISNFSNEIEIDYKTGISLNLDTQNSHVNWNVRIINTGVNRNTAERIKSIEKFILEDNFFLTYGDGLSDVNLDELQKSHIQSNKIVTVTAVRPINRFGLLEFGPEEQVTKFVEKPQMAEWISGGFFVLQKEIFKYLIESSNFEESTMHKIANLNQLNAFKHSGFWFSVDTYRELTEINKMYSERNTPWLANG